MFTENDLKQIAARGITEEKVRQQLEQIAEEKRSFSITNEDGVFIVTADWLAPILYNCNMEDYESLQYFQRVLRQSGIIDELERMGIEEDDMVSIYDFEFNYVR